MSLRIEQVSCPAGIVVLPATFFVFLVNELLGSIFGRAYRSHAKIMSASVHFVCFRVRSRCSDNNGQAGGGSGCTGWSKQQHGQYQEHQRDQQPQRRVAITLGQMRGLVEPPEPTLTAGEWRYVGYVGVRARDERRPEVRDGSLGA